MVSPIFRKRYIIFTICYFPLILTLFTYEDFLISPCYSLGVCISLGISFPKLLPLAHLHSCTWTDPSLLAHIYHFILSHLSTPFLYVFFFFSTPLTYKYTPKTKQQKSYFPSHQASLNSSVSHLSSIFLLLINFSDSLWGLCICGL